MYRTLTRIASGALAAACLSGCPVAGPFSIQEGRAHYNEVIHQTSMKQTFDNILRVYQHQPTLFMDVTEVDASLQFSAGLTGNISGIDAHAGSSGGTLAGKTKGIAGSLDYAEQPTIRYVPLLGASLVDQTASPISIDSIVNLYNSDWPLESILSLSIDRITPGYEDYSLALDAILELESYGALVLSESVPRQRSQSTTQIYLVEKADGQPGPASSPRKPGIATPPANALLLTLVPVDPQLAHLAHPQPSEPASPDENEYSGDIRAARTDILQLWIRLLRIYDQGARLSCADQSLGVVDAQLKRGPVPDEVLDLLFAALPRSIALTTSIDAANPPDVLLTIPGTAAAGHAGALHMIDRVNAGITGIDACRSLGAARNATGHPPSANRNKARGATTPAPPPVAPSMAQQQPELLITTRSALGALKYATEGPDPMIGFVTPAVFGDIRRDEWNAPTRVNGARFYTLKCQYMNSVMAGEDDCASPGQDPRDIAIYRYLAAELADPDQSRYIITLDTDNSLDSPAKRYLTARRELFLDSSRRFILIIRDVNEPADAYIASFQGGYWYYIDKDDDISQINFSLISALMTIQATTPQNPPLTPTIPVGGRN